MITFITAVHIVVCLFLVVVVLLQMGKGAELGSVFGGSSQSVFGSSGPGSFLEKVTVAAAVIFMVTSISLFYFSKTSSIAGKISIEEKQEQTETTPAPQPLSPEPAQPPQGQ
jgi:preprotein translocase subunit SecG